ncbi:MAG TPA: phospho-N-acetylmuramoyl-pentapeptide-transferase [Anaerolineales bacterium]|nr:phospho-N-acetylmuramoyl-pentapeptide-transferase [Anaerolineales bacterium]
MSPTSIALGLAGVSFMLTVIWGQPLIRILRHYRVGERITISSPQGQFTQVGTPTTGGVLFIIPIMLLTLLLNGITIIGMGGGLGESILLPLGTMLGFGTLGLISDWRRIRNLHPSGIRPRYKLLIQIILAGVIAYGLWWFLDAPHMYLPFYKGEFEMGIWYLPAAILLIVITSNATTSTTSVQGLTGLIAATAFASYGVVASIQEQVFIARFCFTVVGSLFGFLWFNIKPAELLMGYTGSYAIGATLAVIALMTGQWPMLVFIFVIPFLEAGSAALQIIYYRLTGRRIFRMAPLHHHLELAGWSETQIVQRFWLINFLIALIGITLSLV